MSSPLAHLLFGSHVRVTEPDGHHRRLDGKTGVVTHVERNDLVAVDLDDGTGSYMLHPTEIKVDHVSG